MSGQFGYGLSSDPPSTPDSRRAEHPSTTPAGPPPTGLTQNSFTPAGAPPASSIFGSQGGSTRPAFKADGRVGSNLFSKPGSSTLNSSVPGYKKRGGGNMFGLLGSSPPKAGRGYEEDDDDDDEEGEEEDGDYEEEDDEMEEEDAEGDEEDEDMDEDAEGEDEDGEELLEDEDQLVDAPAYGRQSYGRAPAASSLLRNSQGLGGSFGGSIVGVHPSIETGPPLSQTKHDFAKLARARIPRGHVTQLHEPNDVILKQERMLQDLHNAVADNDSIAIGRLLGDISRDLPELWEESATGSVIPTQKTPKNYNSLKQASYLASLLIRLHHPPAARSASDLNRSSLVRHSRPPPDATIAQVLLDWLNNYHLETPSDVDIVLSQKSNYSTSPTFWDAVLRSALRGKFEETVTLLRDANFSVAETAPHDGARNGYTDLQLSYVQKAVDDAILTLQNCPALTSGDWDIRGQAWEAYRRRIVHANDALREFSEGQSYDRTAGLGSRIGVASRIAECKVPWTIYENLTALYATLLGDADELVSSSSDWIEAVIVITAWWDGSGQDQVVPPRSLAASRTSMSQSRSRSTRLVDTAPAVAYRAKLASALAHVVNTEDEELEINETSFIDVALGCVFESHTDSAISLIRSLSMVVAVAVEEIAGAGRWGSSAPKSLMKGFDKSDLMVLSFGKDQRAGGEDEVDKDQELVTFAQAVSRRCKLVGDDSESREGWQLAIQILSRLDNPDMAETEIKSLVNGLDLESTERVDKILKQLLSMGFSEQAGSIAERYADDLASTTYDYGSTIYYYARAHNSQKLHSILDLLISLSLVNSMAYPPEEDLDPHLKNLLTSPREVAGKLAQTDHEAAATLANSLSGYATIRKFYNLRDAQLKAARTGTKPSHRPLAQRKAAVAALMALIASAATPIRGGLYDPEAESVLQVDGLLVLLGETLPLLKMEPTPFTMRDFNILLAAIEDIATSPHLIRSQCEECLKATLSAGHGLGLAEPDMRDLLNKSISGLSEKTAGTASSQFSLVGSSLLEKSRGAESKVLEERAWDWRRGFKGDARAEDVLSVLRITVVGVVGRLWVESDGFEGE